MEQEQERPNIDFEPIVRFDDYIPDSFKNESIVIKYGKALDQVIEFEPWLREHAVNVSNVMQGRMLAGQRQVTNPQQVSDDLMADNSARGQVINAWNECSRVFNMFNSIQATFGHWLWDNVRDLDPEKIKPTIEDKKAVVGKIMGEGDHYLTDLEDVLDMCRRLTGQVDSTGFAYKDSIEAMKRDREVEVRQ